MWSKHILLLPLMAQGHLQPFLQLAHQIKARSRGLTLTILSTPRNVQLLREMSREVSEPETDPACSVVRLVELPFRSSNHGMHVENTNALPLTAMIKLLHSSTALEGPLRRFIVEEMVGKEGFPPLCIISDWFLGWAVQVATSFGSLAFTFSTAGAYGSAAYASLWRDLPHRNCARGEEFNFPGFPKTHSFDPSHLSPIARVADGADEWSRFFEPQLSMSMSSSGWLCNTVEEFEPLGLSILRSYIKLPVWAVGSAAVPKGADGSEVRHVVIKWLDLQDEESVVYVSFGSQNTITCSQMMELAAGLEESGRRFVWVIRPPFGFDVEEEFRPEWLPEGFLERVVNRDKRGFLVHKFAPQRDILAHKSIGAFLSHCGWNSVLEGLSQGVPIIGWPLAAEQAFNSKMLEEEVQVAVEVARGLEAKVTKEEVKQAVEVALDRHGKGGELKREATAVAAKLRLATMEEGGRKGSALHAIDDFLHTLLLHQSSTI